MKEPSCQLLSALFEVEVRGLCAVFGPSLAGCCEDAEVLVLSLNASKSGENMSAQGFLLCSLPGAVIVEPSKATTYDDVYVSDISQHRTQIATYCVSCTHPAKQQVIMGGAGHCHDVQICNSTP